MASTPLLATQLCLAQFYLLVPAVAGASAIAGLQDVVGGPNVSSALSIAGIPAAVRVSRVESVAVVVYTRTKLHLAANRST